MTIGNTTPRRGANWWRAMHLIWRSSPGAVCGTIVVTVVSGVIPAVQVHLTATVVQSVSDAITGGGGAPLVRAAIRAALAFAAVSVAGNLLGTVQGYLQTILQLQLTNKVSQQILDKAIRLDLRHYEDDKYYDNLQRANREAGTRPFQLFTDVLTAGELSIGLLSLVSVLFSWDPRLGLLLLAAPLPALAANLFFGRRSYQIEFQRAPERRQVAYLQYLLTNERAVKEIRLMRLGGLLLDRYRASIARFYLVDRGLTRRQTLVSVPLSLLAVAVSAASMIYAMLTTIASGLVGQFSGFVQAIARVQSSVSGLLGVASKLYKNTKFVGNLFDFLDLPESTLPSGQRPFPPRLTYGIEFRDVTFVYPGTTRTALDGLTCLLPAGRCVAVVGVNGAGKTTLVKLLTRLYEPTCGSILVDGVPIEEYDLEDLRRNIGVIFQDFVQYELSARENIGFGRVEDLHDLERVREAARSSNAAEFLEDLPGDYDATLGRMFENGNQLSGGQWQKVALARAFIRKAPVVVLDEPTASIDAEAEEEIFDRLRTIAADATALLIAHRFSTVRMADHIIVLEHGRLIEEGSHEWLLNAGGRYARMFMLQAAGYLAAVDSPEPTGAHADGRHQPRHAHPDDPAPPAGQHRPKHAREESTYPSPPRIPPSRTPTVRRLALARTPRYRPARGYHPDNRPSGGQANGQAS